MTCQSVTKWVCAFAASCCWGLLARWTFQCHSLVMDTLWKHLETTLGLFLCEKVAISTLVPGEVAVMDTFFSILSPGCMRVSLGEREREREEKCNLFPNFSAHKDKHRISPAELLLCTWVGNIGTTAWLKKVGGGNWRDPQQRKIFFFWVCVGDECWLIPPIIQPLRSQVHRFFWPPLASCSALSQARKSKCQSSSIVPAFSAVMYYLLTRCVCWISSLISQRIPLQHETFASSSVPI